MRVRPLLRKGNVTDVLPEVVEAFCLSLTLLGVRQHQRAAPQRVKPSYLNFSPHHLHSREDINLRKTHIHPA